MSLKISGTTRVVGLFGWPVAHSLSPPMHNAAFEAAGLDFIYLCFPVAPDQVEQAVKSIRALGLAGINVTIPHKTAVIPFVDEISKAAQTIGAVNTIVNTKGRLSAHNTDVYGFLRSLKERDVKVKGADVVIIGAGGVARAMAMGSAVHNTQSITLCDVIAEKARELAGDVKRMAPSVDVKTVEAGSTELKSLLARASIVCNATPLGMKEGDSLPLDEESLDAIPGSAAIFDAVYSPFGTPLEKRAQARGLEYIGGLNMLLFQGVRAFELWTGHSPDIQVMKKVLKNKIT